MSDPDQLQNASAEEDESATTKPGGLGGDGTIPNNPNGIAAGHTGEPSHFEPEEDDEA